METLSALLIGLLSVAGVGAKDAHGVHWVFPTPDLTFYYLDTVSVQYTSSFDKPRLYTFCSGGNRQSKTPTLCMYALTDS